MKNITMIAAVGKNLELGKDNDLIWHFKEDMKFFKENTINKPIVMGMKTLESLPHLLPKRTHIVLTRQNKKLDNGIIIVHSVDELLDYIKRYDDEVMIIGGASVYKEMLEYSDKLILTEIDATHDADVYFPSFNKEEWDSKVVGEQEENNIKYKHLVYTRKNNKNN
ncbi:MAG: dihydrofolate reductase [Bacilli bacterium]|nr:dihydrofolate reductase [Bacilli bacterium]